jgi:hypothetical protein
MEGRKRLKALHFDPSDPCRKPHVPGSKVIEVSYPGEDILPFVGQPAVIKETRHSSRKSIPTDFYHDSEKRTAVEAVAAAVRKQKAAAEKVVAVKNERTRHSARKSIPTDFYVAGLHDAMTRSAQDYPKKKRKTNVDDAKKSPQQIPKKPTTVVKHKIITVEEAVLQMERNAQEEEGTKKHAKTKKTMTVEKTSDSTKEAKKAESSPPPKPRERGHFASPMVLIPLSECILPPSTSPPKVKVSSPRKQSTSPTKMNVSLPPKRQAETKEKTKDVSPVKKKKRRRKIIPAALRRRPQVISVLISAGLEAAQLPKKKKKEPLNEGQVSPIDDDMPISEIVAKKQSKRQPSDVDKAKKMDGTKKPKKKQNGFKNKIGKLVRRYAPVKLKRKRKRKKVVKALKPEPVDCGESDWADAEGDDGFYDDAIDSDDENESFQSVIPAPDDTSVIKKSEQAAEQPKRKRGRPRKSEQTNGGIDEKKSTEQVILAPYDAYAIEKSDQIVVQPDRKRGRPLNSEQVGGGIDEKESAQDATQAPNKASAAENSDQTAKQPKRKPGRPRKSDRKNGGIVERETAHDATQVPNGASAMEKSNQTAMLPRTSDRKDGEIDEKGPVKNAAQVPIYPSVIRESDQTAQQPKRKRGRPRKSEPKNGGIVYTESIQEATQAADNAPVIKESDQHAMQPKRKRGRLRKSDRKDDGIDTQQSAQDTTRAPDNAAATEKSDQIAQQPKRKRGRPLNSDRKDGKIVEKASAKDATHAPDNSSNANNVRQTASQPKPRGLLRKNDCGIDEAKAAQPKRGRGRPRKNECGNDEAKSAQQKLGKGRWRRSVWKACGKCLVCRQAENCGRCEPCLNMPEFGGDGSRGVKCVLRVCITPIYILNDETTNQSDNDIDRNQGVTSKEVTLWRDSGVESLSDNDSMAVDDMSDMEWDDGYKRPFASATVVSEASVAECGVRKPTQAGSLPNQQTSANAVGNEGQMQGVAGRNALDSAERSDPTGKTNGNEIASDFGKIGIENDMNSRSGDDMSHEDAAGMARKLLRYERMQYLNDYASHESSSDEDCLLVPPPPPLDCEQ